MRTHTKVIFFIFLFIFVRQNDSGTGQRLLKAATGSKIQGNVVDAETGAPLSDVNVFLANTTIGTASDLSGNFVIYRVPQGAYTLIISRIGYEIFAKEIEISYEKNLTINVRLSPKTISGEEVVVKGEKLKNWEKNYKKFLKLFMGESGNAKKTEILNPYVLNFSADPAYGKFYAFSDSSLRIRNNALGYEMRIVFHRFELDQDRLIYGIYSHYQEMKPVDSLEKIQWQRRRRETFLGSFKHFLISLVKNRVKEEGFELYQIMSLDRVGASRKIDLKKEKLIQPDVRDGIYLLQFDLYLGVRYTSKSKWNPQVTESVLYLNAPYAKIDSLGNILNGYAITIRGDWTKRRIPDLLPLDYRFDESYEIKN
ncbi:MAG: carboxypeptidase-like regulatory domain-containing protein [Calditrichaeota bacterium]|nr:carboxypeptidase-like regulatory domain-containing protein [Calditrichota bacterium]